MTSYSRDQIHSRSLNIGLDAPLDDLARLGLVALILHALGYRASDAGEMVALRQVEVLDMLANGQAVFVVTTAISNPGIPTINTQDQEP